jgi:hypothetical protein
LLTKKRSEAVKKILVKVAIWSSSIPVFKNIAAEGLGLFGTANLNISERLTVLKEVLDKARTWLDIETSPLPVLKVFVAPEYLLLKSSNKKAISFDEFQLATSQSRLESWSEGLLFIPGTVVWKKPAATQSEPPLTDRPLKIENKLERYADRQRNYYTRKSGAVSSLSEKWIEQEQNSLREKLDKLKAAAPQQDVYIARNVAYIYYDGKLLMSYKKQSEFKRRTSPKKTGELTALEKTSPKMKIKFVPGYKEGRFEVRLNESILVRCGVEICADHSTQQVKYAGDGKELDLQILLSDYISSASLSVAVKQGGYVVHASTDPDVSGVYDKELKQVASAMESTSLTYGKLCYYAQELDV